MRSIRKQFPENGGFSDSVGALFKFTHCKSSMQLFKFLCDHTKYEKEKIKIFYEFSENKIFLQAGNYLFGDT